MNAKSTAYDELVRIADAQGQQCMGGNRRRVVPSYPNESLLVQKLEGTQNCGSRMPAGDAGALSQALINEVRSWIAAGALYN